MKSITPQISEDELREVTQAYKTLRDFLDKVISPNELYLDEFLKGLHKAQSEVENKEFSEVESFADFVCGYRCFGQRQAACQASLTSAQQFDQTIKNENRKY